MNPGGEAKKKETILSRAIELNELLDKMQGELDSHFEKGKTGESKEDRARPGNVLDEIDDLLTSALAQAAHTSEFLYTRVYPKLE